MTRPALLVLTWLPVWAVGQHPIALVFLAASAVWLLVEVSKLFGVERVVLEPVSEYQGLDR